MSKWKEIRNNHINTEENVIYIDAWKSMSDSEEGKVIAKIDLTTKKVTYFDEVAKTDSYAQEVIKEVVARIGKDVIPAILVERDYKGQYERFALTPEEFEKEFPETYKNFGPIEESNSDTLKPLVHIWFEPCKVGDKKWNTFFSDMEEGLPESDIEAGNLAYIREDLFQSLKEYLPENTKINYLYRDASNYKVYNSAVVAGKISEEQKEQIMNALNDGEWFIPAKVGLPANRFETFTQDDHYWFELKDFESTKDTPTVSLTVTEFVETFIKCKDNWEEGIDKYGNLVASEKLLKAINIKWDIDYDDEYDEEVVLPTEIEIPKGMTDEDEISDYLSDVTSYCHYGFELVESISKYEKMQKPKLDELISSALQKGEEKKTWIEEKSEELSSKPRSEWTEEDWEAHNYCENVTAEADYFDSLDDR